MTRPIVFIGDSINRRGAARILRAAGAVRPLERCASSPGRRQTGAQHGDHRLIRAGRPAWPALGSRCAEPRSRTLLSGLVGINVHLGAATTNADPTYTSEPSRRRTRAPPRPSADPRLAPRMILVEPFVLAVTAEQALRLPDWMLTGAGVAKLAAEFGAGFVPPLHHSTLLTRPRSMAPDERSFCRSTPAEDACIRRRWASELSAGPGSARRGPL